jgi:hypothetical protein
VLARLKGENGEMNWQAIKRFNFTWAIPGGAWLEDENGARAWVSWSEIIKHKSREWVDRQLRKQGQWTGCWVEVQEA